MPGGLRRLGWRLGPLVVYAALIFFFSSRPARQLPRLVVPHADKLVHAVEYAGLGLLLVRALRRSEEPVGVGLAALAVGLGGLYGATDEYHQSFVPGRSGNDLGDLTADLIGTALGVLLHRRCFRNPRWRSWL